MTSQIKEDIYDKYLQSEVILYCLKKCINGSHLSPVVKVKVLSLLYDLNESFEETTIRSDFTSTNSRTVRSESTTLGTDNKQEYNFLGIDDDIILESPEKLTLEQQAELRDCILEELTIFYKFCASVNSHVKVPNVKGNIDDLLCDLEENIMKQTLQLENFVDLQKSICDAKLENCTTLHSIIDSEVEKLLSLKYTGCKLLEEIDKEIMDGDRRQYYERAERILEEKIKNDKKIIEQLQFELMELNIKY